MARLQKGSPITSPSSICHRCSLHVVLGAGRVTQQSCCGIDQTQIGMLHQVGSIEGRVAVHHVEGSWPGCLVQVLGHGQQTASPVRMGARVAHRWARSRGAWRCTTWRTRCRGRTSRSSATATATTSTPSTPSPSTRSARHPAFYLLPWPGSLVVFEAALLAGASAHSLKKPEYMSAGV